MKKLALALMAISASIFGLSAVANAYPPAPGANEVSDSTPAPGADYNVTVGCEPVGAGVVFAFQGVTATITCTASTGPASLLSAAPAAGSATATFTAPTAPGTYTGTYTGAATGSWTITVAAAASPAPGGGLPATGSDGTSTMTIMAIGLFAVGAGLFGVSQMRRRTAAA